MPRAHTSEAWPGLVRFGREHSGYVQAVLDEVRDRGPLRSSELTDPGTKVGPWWGWNRGKQALEFLFWAGEVSATRLPNFERVYDVTERMVPPAIFAAPTPSEDDAKRELLRLSARSLGVATLADLCDYYRLNVPTSRAFVAEMVEAGELLPVDVEGWRDQAYVRPDTAQPRRIAASALLSPFDSLVWFRPRTERLFDFHYRIEIYTPAPKRVYGYYVLPYLLGEDIVARVDMKADRKNRALLVPGAFAELGHPVEAIAAPLAAELQQMAVWLGLERVVLGRRGDLLAALRKVKP
jgi:uncharacterized protein YcaQ